MNIKKNFKRFFTLSRRSDAGFTLVELIVVIAILAILAGVAIPAYSGYVKKAERAGDEQLLAAVNTAYAAACIAEGTDMSVVNGAYIGLTADKTVDLASVTPYGTSFAQFYAGNEASAFKTFAGLYFDLNDHMFKEGSEAYMNAFNAIMNDPEMAGSISALQASAYAAMGATSLLGAVDGVTSLAIEMLVNEDSALGKIVWSEDGSYLSNLATNILGLDSVEDLDAMLTEMDDGGVQFLANSTVLTVATTMQDEEFTNSLVSSLQSGNLAAVVDTITDPEKTGDQQLAAAALVYGMYTAYNPDAAANITSAAGLQNLVNDKDGFVTYLSNLNDPDSNVSMDLDGYLGGLNVVNSAIQDSPDVAYQVMTNGYIDPELVGLIGGVIGG